MKAVKTTLYVLAIIAAGILGCFVGEVGIKHFISTRPIYSYKINGDTLTIDSSNLLSVEQPTLANSKGISITQAERDIRWLKQLQPLNQPSKILQRNVISGLEKSIKLAQ